VSAAAVSPPGSLGEALERAAAGPGTIVEDGHRHDFAALLRASDEVAASLAGARLEGARLALAVQNTFQHLAAVFGVWRAGGTLVPLHPRLTAAEVEALGVRAGVAARLEVASVPGRIEIAARREGAATDAGLAAIAFTSGTTGAPKGVCVTHAGMLFAAAAVSRTRRDHPGSVAAVVSPLCHVPIFVSHLLCRLLTGGTVVIGRFDPDRLVAAITAEGVTDLPLVPAMVAPLLAHPGFAGVTSVRKLTVGSAATAMETKQALAAALPAAEIIEAYGQTESTDGLTMTIGREALERPGTVGRAHRGMEVAIVTRAGDVAGAGVEGEIVTRGPMVMRGYLDDPTATAETIRRGWLHTGDLGRLDAEGYLSITGRLKELIISGGENVSPVEVEAALADHPAVADVAVVGVPDARWGEQVVAAVVTCARVEPEVLMAHARARLAPYKCPRQVVFVAAIPRTANGKVRRQAVRGEVERLIAPRPPRAQP
jgi:acyl-CoA synthetase (AMP-forming)/AMP-acid ligase II